MPFAFKVFCKTILDINLLNSLIWNNSDLKQNVSIVSENFLNTYTLVILPNIASSDIHS